MGVNQTTLGNVGVHLLHYTNQDSKKLIGLIGVSSILTYGHHGDLTPMAFTEILLTPLGLGDGGGTL